MKSSQLSELDRMVISAIGTILAEHKGRENAIKGKDLLAILRRIDPILENYKMRRLIAKYHPDTCSTSSSAKGGYFKAADANEAKVVIDFLEGYIRHLSRRRTAILIAYPEAGQLTLGI